MLECKFSTGLAAAPEARAIREHVFVREQGFELEFDSIDERAYHIVVLQDGIPAATGRAYSKEGSPQTWILGRIAVEKPYRGKQLGAFVLKELEQYVQNLHPVECFELSAQVRARGFYEKQGYCAYGEEHMDEYCPHIGMRKTVSCI